MTTPCPGDAGPPVSDHDNDCDDAERGYLWAARDGVPAAGRRVPAERWAALTIASATVGAGLLWLLGYGRGWW